MKTTEIEQSQEQEQKPGRKSRGNAAQPAAGAAKGAAKPKTRRMSPKALYGKVLHLIANVYQSLEQNHKKLSVSDLTRLVQLEKELRPQSYQRMVVEWVDRKRGGE